MAKTNSVMGGSAEMSPRKAMGMGMADSGASSVESMQTVQRPKSITGAKSGKELGDGQRGIGAPVSRGKGMHPGQANPDHGSTHPMGTGTAHYSGKV